MKVAAFYARKSTEQRDVADEQKSVERQIEGGKAFASRKGWRLPKALIYADDAVSGAETKKLVNRQRLLDAIGRPDRPFDVLIMRDASRFSRRDGLESFAELKQIAEAGVEIWFYEDGTQFRYGTLETNVFGFMRGEVNAEYRRGISRLVREAMTRKAKSGYHTGGKVYGYDNEEVRVGGKRSHVRLVINKTQAAIVRRIFTRAADGAGYSRIANELNDDGIPPQRGTRWAPNSIRAVLTRPLYYGKRFYNQSIYVDAPGGKRKQKLPRSKWTDVPAGCEPLITEEMFRGAAAQRQKRMAVMDGKNRGGQRRDRKSNYLLNANAMCGVCGGTLCVKWRDIGPNGRLCSSDTTGATRQPFYACMRYQTLGRRGCTNVTTVPVDSMNRHVLDTILKLITGPDFCEKTVKVVAALQATGANADKLEPLQTELASVEVEVANLVKAVTAGRGGEAVFEAAEERQARAAALRRQITAFERPMKRAESKVEIAKRVKAQVDRFTKVLAADRIEDTRALLGTILDGPIRVTPAPALEPPPASGRNQYGPRKDTRRFQFEGSINNLPFLGLPANSAIPTGSVTNRKQIFLGIAA